MRSKASIKGHPVHPMLIAFPIAFLAGAVLADLAGVIVGEPFLWTMGAWLAMAGIISAVIAAIPGFIDYFATVPPNSSGKRRATYHMIVNLLAVGLFALAWVMRGVPTAQPGLAVLVLEIGGISLLAVGGWLGGTLVYRNLIAVDHRYADTGKWNEEHFDAPDDGAAMTVAKQDELEVNQMKLLHIGDRRIVLARTEDGYVAFDDHCTHRGGSLAGGVLVSGCVQCLWHGSQFDVRTGEVRSGPAEKSIPTYRVEQRDGRVLLYPAPQGRVPAPEYAGT